MTTTEQTLPPLPQACYPVGDGKTLVGYSSVQMRAYASEAVRNALERYPQQPTTDDEIGTLMHDIRNAVDLAGKGQWNAALEEVRNIKADLFRRNALATQAPTGSMEAAARWVEKRAEDYAAAHGSTDPDTGTREYPGDGAEYYGELMEIAEGLRALEPPKAPRMDDLAHTIRKLAHALRKASPDHTLPNLALDYLKRVGLQGSPFRSSDATQAPALTDEPKRRDWNAIEKHVDDYLEDYEMRGDDEDGRDACHTPSADEIVLVKDAISGLLSDSAFRTLLAAASPTPKGDCE